MEHISTNIETYFTHQEKKRRPNQFWDLCSFCAEIHNRANPEKERSVQSFFKDCQKNRLAYEMAQLDFYEKKTFAMSPEDQAKLFFGMLKWRKTLDYT